MPGAIVEIMPFKILLQNILRRLFLFLAMAEDHVHSPIEYQLMEVKPNYKKS